MGYMDLIALLHRLPLEKQMEVFDFVEFIAMRSGVNLPVNTPFTPWTEEEFSRFSMQQALRGLEDEPVSYTRDDLKVNWL